MEYLKLTIECLVSMANLLISRIIKHQNLLIIIYADSLFNKHSQ